MAKTALVVDDSVFMRAQLAEMVSSIEEISTVYTAENGKEAISKCNTFKPDVVTMDIDMPELGGIDATKKILSNNPQTIVIFVSAMERKRFSQDVEDAGGLGYIKKPFDKNEVIDAIKELIGSRINQL